MSQVAVCDFYPSGVTVEPLAISVGLVVPFAESTGAVLVRMAPWQALDLARELRVVGPAEGVPSRCGWRTSDGDILLLDDVTGGSATLHALSANGVRAVVGLQALNLLAEDLETAYELVLDLDEAAVVRAATEGWA